MRFFHMRLWKRTLRLVSVVTLLVFCLSLIAWVIKTDESDTEFRDEFNTKEVNTNHNLRTKLMHEYCGKTGKYMNDSQEKHLDLSKFIVLEKYKLVYCPVPKVSCTVWKNLLAKLDGANIKKNVHKEVKYKLNSLQGYSLEDQRTILKTYTKFMFVREPFERLLSSYRDVFWDGGNEALISGKATARESASIWSAVAALGLIQALTTQHLKNSQLTLFLRIETAKTSKNTGVQCTIYVTRVTSSLISLAITKHSWTTRSLF
ncbi:Carbohydrate sulfotransferase 12 [Desmophyllum pertusum]|uniref:Carbohydrate sulfotransferase n=1 Tax=Desmophyllum pertusum TaxID=174260 RepID=A0A9W9Z6B0_9CNID|nr:Carbohydrate sulfotransferase 12 [Desmophyllum pertusum]